MADAAAIAVLATGAGALAVTFTARWFQRVDRLPSLEGWALADRRLSSRWVWLLLGGTMFTAYTFTAVPGAVFSTGALGFFALPYVIVLCPLAFVVLPRLASAARQAGHVTIADLVRERYESRPLALCVALTGILATMPYLALQLLGIRTVVQASGIGLIGLPTELVVLGLFAGLAVASYHHGLRAPCVAASLKAVLIFVSAALAVVVGFARSGGPGVVFDRASQHLAKTGAGSLILGPHQYLAFLTLAFGSALALLMYPHVATVAFAARDDAAVQRASAGLTPWSSLVAVFALLAIVADARTIRLGGANADAAVIVMINQVLPDVLAGLVFGAIVVGALVPAAVMSIATGASFARNVFVEYLQPAATPKRQLRVARSVSLIAKLGAVGFMVGLRPQAAINLQLLGGIWILQTAPTVLLVLSRRRPGAGVLLSGWLAGMVIGTTAVVSRSFSAVVSWGVAGHSVELYAGFAALMANLAAVAVGLSVVRLRLVRGRLADDRTMTGDAAAW